MRARGSEFMVAMTSGVLLHLLESFTAGGTAGSISPSVLGKGCAGADTIVIGLLEMCASAAFRGRCKGRTGLTALSIDRKYGFAEGAHSLFAIKMYIVFAIEMFHFPVIYAFSYSVL